MSARRPSPKYITEAIEAVRRAGVPVGRVELTADGLCIYAPGGDTAPDPIGDWKRARKSQRGSHGQAKAR